IEVTVVDDCGLPMNSGSVVVSFSNGDPPIALVRAGEGRWAGTWTAHSAQTSRVTVIAKARSSSNLSGEVQVSGGLQDNTGVPVLRSSAIVNSADPAAPLPLAPGSLISLFGVALSGSEQVAPGLPLPYQLSGTSVLLAGRRLPLLYVGER